MNIYELNLVIECDFFFIMYAFSILLILLLCMNFSYRGGVDSEGRPVMVVIGAHFLLRCLDLERFVLYVIKVLSYKEVAFQGLFFMYII